MVGRRRHDPLLQLAPHLDGCDALEAARRVARPTGELRALLASPEIDRARLVIDVFEARAHPPDARKAGGVYYTPPRIISVMLDRVPLDDGELLDPSAGAGAFVLELVRRLGPTALDRIRACDLDARALDACVLALEAELGERVRERLSAWRRERCHVVDFVRDFRPPVPPALILGNPPYGLTRDDDLRARFPRLAGEIDLYACFLLRATELVAPGGSVALLVPDTWLTNRRAESLRAHLAGSGLARLIDFGKPFSSARDTRVHAVVLRRDAPHCDVESEREGVLAPMAPVAAAHLKESTSKGWFLYRTSEEARACATLERNGQRLGDLFDVIYGLRTGDNARHVGAGPGAVPLVSGADFDAFDRKPSTRHLLDPASFERALSLQLGRAKLAVQRIRTNSRTPWRRWVEAAPVSPCEAGLDSLTLLASRTPAAQLDDASCALLGVLNSSILNRWYRLSFTDVNVKPSYLSELPVPEPTPELVQLVRARLTTPGSLALERAIDRAVADAWGLDEVALQTLEQGFWTSELVNRPLPSSTELRDFLP